MTNAAAPALSHSGTIVICSSDTPRDRRFARRLARDVGSMGFTVRSHQGRSAEPIPTADIATALAVLVVLSPQLEGSAVACAEYRSALQQRTRIIPLQTDAMPSIPAELGSVQWIDCYELYERGLMNLSQALGRPQPAVAQRLQRADVASKVIPFIRAIGVPVLAILRLLLINNLLSAGWCVAAFIPAIFIEMGVEDYRRGEEPGKRIMLAKMLDGAITGALLGVAGLFIFPVTVALWIVGPCAVLGGGLAWFATWAEQRSLRLGRLGLHRLLGVVGFCTKAITAFLALFAFPGNYSTSQIGSLHQLIVAPGGVAELSTAINLNDPQSAALAIGSQVAISVALAAVVEWLHSPMRRVTKARRQLVEMRKEASLAGASLVSANMVFISHSSGDNDFAVKLSHDLQQRGIATWVDRRRLKAGMSWPEEIRKSLDGARVVLVALSPFSAASEWVRWEYQAAAAQRKNVIALRLDAATPTPPELSQAKVADFSTLYENGLADVLEALHAEQEVVATARQSLRRRLNYAWLISTVRLFSSGYLMLARTLVFALASFMLLGGFDHIAGVDTLSAYGLIWLGRATPGAALGVFVSLEERARVEGAKPSRWMKVARVINGGLMGESLFSVWALGVGGLIYSPVMWLTISFTMNQTPAGFGVFPFNAGNVSFSMVVAAALAVLCVVNGALALPLAHAVERDREQGKRVLRILTRIAEFSARVGIGLMGVVAPLYLLFGSPIAPFGPPSQNLGTSTGYWVLVELLLGLLVGLITAAVELFFFPAGPSRRALSKLRAMILVKRQ